MAYVLGPISISGTVVSITGSLITTQNTQTTASWAINALTASLAPNYVLTSATSSMLSPYVLNNRTSSFISTGSSNTTQIISGSLIIQQNLTVFGSSSMTNVSSSMLNIGTNLITVNTFNPTNRFGGLAIIDSGSSPQVSASFLYDSIQDEFIFVHRGTSNVITSSHFLVGPETYNDLGNEIYISTNRILKSQGNEHITSSNITDTGTLVSVNSSTQITGSLLVSEGITGSLQGTASWASNAVTSSYPISVTGSTLHSVRPSTSLLNTNNSIFFGANAGQAATNANNSIFLGQIAGTQATNANQSIFIGIGAGNSALDAAQSNFIGVAAGQNAVSASFSTLIGYYAGYAAVSAPQTSIGTNNIIIGTNITLPDNTRNSINLGAVIFATGSYSTTTGNPYSGSQHSIGRVGINKVTPEYTLDVSGSGNYSNGLTVTGSIIAASFTGSLQGTASFALNGGVTQIIAGTNVTISPTNGLGAVTINSSGGGSGGAGANITASFTNQSTWTFTHALNNRGVVVQTFDTGWNQIIPENITLTDTNTATITFPTNESGFAIASLGGSTTTAQTASHVNTLNQSVLITGSLTVGSSSAGPLENTLTLGTRDTTNEGGQIGFNAPGGTYTSASFIDNYQDQFRILKGQNANGSTGGCFTLNLRDNSAQFFGAVTASAYSGLPNDYLYVTRNTDQTVVTNWLNTDIIFNNSVVSKGISYNTSTGLATLTGGKVYRVTARLAWSAGAVYNLQYSCYTSANAQIGPTVEIVQSTNGTNNISDGTLEFIYAPGSNTDIKIRTTAANGALSGERIRGDLNTQLIIQQIA